MHPLIEQGEILRGLGECLPLGQTVSIDLTQPIDEQTKAFCKGHRYDLRRLRQSGMIGEGDEQREHLDEFIAIYHETMRRVGATEGYFFDRGYFDALFERLGQQMVLFRCHLAGETTCAGPLWAV